MAEAKKGAKTASKTPRTRNTQKYVRNCYTVPCSVTLGYRPNTKRFEFKARGQRGDLLPVSKEDLADAKMQSNIMAGLLEVIAHAEMLKVIEKQTTNQQTYHPALAHLGNPHNENKPYEDMPEVRIKEEHRIVVATHETHDPTKGVRQQAFVQKVSDPSHAVQDGTIPAPAGSQQNPIPGTVPNPNQSQDALQQADAHARANKSQEGVKSGLQGFKVNT